MKQPRYKKTKQKPHRSYSLPKTWSDVSTVSSSPWSWSVQTLCQTNKTMTGWMEEREGESFYEGLYFIFYLIDCIVLNSQEKQQHHREPVTAAAEWCVFMLSVDVIGLISMTGLHVSTRHCSRQVSHTLCVIPVCERERVCVHACGNVWLSL